MANYTSSDFKRYGPQILTTEANMKVALVKNPVKADNYATFTGKIIAQADLAGGDVSFADSGADLQVTVAAKSGVDPSGTALVTDDLSVACYSTSTQKVHIVQDATNRAITNETGDTVNIPALVHFVREMTAV